MIALQYILFASTVAVAPTDVLTVDAQTVLALLDSNAALVADLSFEFKSVSRSLDQRVPIATTLRTGKYAYTRGAAERLEIETMVNGKPGTKSIVSVAPEERRTLLHSPAGRVQGFIDRTRAEFDIPGGPYRILYLTLADRYRDRIGASCRSAGWERVDDRACLKVSFDLTAGGSVSETLWIDVERGANPLRRELRRMGQVSLRVTGISLAEFGPPGQRVWLPVKGRATGHVYALPNLPAAKGLRFTAEPLSIEEISIDPASVRVNQGIKPESLALSFKKGTYIRDEAKGVIYRHGQPAALSALPSPEDAQFALDQAIAKANEEWEGPVEVVPPGQQTMTAARWLALGIGTVSVLALAVAYVLRRKLQ